MNPVTPSLHKFGRTENENDELVGGRSNYGSNTIRGRTEETKERQESQRVQCDWVRRTPRSIIELGATNRRQRRRREANRSAVDREAPSTPVIDRKPRLDFSAS